MSDATSAVVEMVIAPRARDLGDGFMVRRVLPFAKRRALGPFVFFDHMGPTEFPAGAGLDVRPHPHIGLATVTYLFAGEILHRDSIGTVATIRPGEVNWMTAGRGIAHSERTPAESRRAKSNISGVQLWVALPLADEEAAPGFEHRDASELPLVERDGATVRVIAGTLMGRRSPLRTYGAPFCADVTLAKGARLTLAPEHEERGFYAVEGEVTLAGEAHAAMQLVVLNAGAEATIEAKAATRLIYLGGAKLDAPRHIWWNFVSSSEARIERAKADWKEGRFAPVVDETEFIPLPA